MNKQSETLYKPKLKKSTREWLLTLAVGLVLAIVAVQVFKTDEGDTTEVVAQSEKEKKISLLLQEIEGVGKSNVMICETEEGVQSVVVVCEGANNFQVVLSVREAVATALGTKQSAVKIYLKKE